MKIKFTLKRNFIFVIIIIGLISLAGLNFLGWVFLQGLKTDITDELKNQIVDVGNICTRLINGNDMENILPDMENSPLILFYQQLLYEIKLTNEFENILILDPAGRLLVDFRLNYKIGDQIPQNPRLFQKASIGEIPDPELVKSGNQYFLSAYIPIRNNFDETVAILIIDTPLEYFSTLIKFETGTLYIAAGGLFILIGFSFIIIFSTKRLFQVEDQMREQKRLAQLGQMAATVAHEIRNPLSIMKGTADVLQKRYKQTADEMFNFIPDEIDRLNRLVNDFLQFARDRTINLQKISLKEIIEETLKPLNKNQIILDLPESIPDVYADRDALKQIFLNLIHNAVEASPNTSPINIHVFERKIKPAKLNIEIKDSGSGISQEDLEKVFDPFYSTKASGSGLGLAICKQLIEKMGGSINIESETGKGTLVRISIRVN